MATRTKEPVTFGGWYEHEDGTVGLYGWHHGQPKCSTCVASWADVPKRDYAAEDRASHATTRGQRS
jgi:hypothetical protein